MKILRHLIILIGLLLCLLGLSPVAQAHIYWNPSSGSDNNNGSTEALAVKSWSKAKELIASTPDHWIVLCATCSNITLDGYLTATKNAKVIRKNGWGGVMFSGNLTASNVTIDGRCHDGSTPSNCGSMIASGNTITIDAGTVIQNNHSTQFGAIWIYNGGTLVMNGGTIQNCDAVEGGAIFSGANNSFYIHGGTIKNCSASQNGGAIALRSGSYTLTIDGGTIENCSSPKGGAVYVAPIWNTNTNDYTYVNGTITMSGGTIKNCNDASILCGAAFYVIPHGSNSSITLNLSGGTIDNCDTHGTTAYDGGGGVFCSNHYNGTTTLSNPGALTLNLSGTTIKNCDAVRGGGVHVYAVKANITFSGGVIDNCSGSVYGGGAYVNGLKEGSSFTMDNTTAGTTGCEIKNCSSIGNSGGAGLFLYNGDHNPSIHLTKGLIHGCRNEDPNNAGSGRGGGLVISTRITAYIDGDNMKIYDNYAFRYGGGIQLSDAAILYFSKGEIYNNGAGDGAAGIHVTGSAELYISGGKLYGNSTPGVGGGFHSSEGCTLSITGGKIYNNIAHTQGGGININTRCNLEIPANSTLEMYGNKACRGGAIMVDGATLTIRAGSYHDNQALDSYTPSGTNVQVDTYGTGGAFCLVTANNANTYASECYLYGGTLNKNSASKNGGAIYIGKTTSVHEDPTQQPGNPAMHILGAATISNNKALDGNGGGIFLETGTFEMTAGTISGNKASQYGGGFYVTTVTDKTVQADIEAGSIVSDTATYGGGFAVVGGTCNIKGTSVKIGDTGAGNVATYGGGLYAHGGTTTITKGNLQYNKATQDGGAIYADGGTATVNYGATSYGKIHHNYAAKRGGGLFISGTGRLDLKGKTTLEYNRVPEGELGGGVYLEGTVQAGASSSDIIIVKDNYADNTEGATITASNRNNIYLPDPVDTQTKDVITVVNNGLNLSSSKIGFSVPHNFVPVIYCATASYLSPTIMNSEAIFEDSERYTKYYSTTSPYKANYIYLSADTWFAAVASQPAGFSYSNIDSPEDLAWLISLVNGRTTPSVTASTLSGVTVRLTADIDMKAHTWVPIGYTGKSFNGTFDGNGHTISNVFCNYLGENEGGTGRGLGLFGTVENATIHDVFVNGVELEVKNQTGSDAYSMGAIANEAKGATTIYNCTAASKMESTMANTTMGGLVGKLTSGTIHSSAAMPDMTGYIMGGIAGTSAGDIYNSFANPRFKYSGAANACFVGGLVADNSGIIQNCYVRFSRTNTGLANAKFGQLAGSAGSNLISECYTPVTFSSDVPSAIKNTGTLSSSTYSNVSAPYLYSYNNTDNLVAGTSASLVSTLTLWANNHSSGSTVYAPWKRTSAGGYSTGAGNINGDYPIHRHEAYTCAASTNNGVTLDYAVTLDGILARHKSNATVNLYANDRTTASTGDGVVVYIDENVSLLQDVGSSSPASSIEAHTCQTIDGSPRSWHFVSSSLEDSYIGFIYDHYSTFNWNPNPCGVTISSNDNASLFPSDLPLSDGYADVARIDLYAFYEPEYHWINLKRRSDSHWHMNNTSVPITYTNETTLTPGKGYLVSVDKDLLLQNRGTLNNGNVDFSLDYTPANAWAGLLGYNLIGNPYQSYLDFNAFATLPANAGLWYDSSKGAEVEPTYAVYDAEMGGYIQYKKGSSRGSKSARGMLNMHQGFMIRVASAGKSAHFTNDMRTNNGTPTGVREEQPAYPLINLIVTDDEGVKDFAVLELGRDTDEGAEKLRANDSKGWLYLHYGSDNYGILFRSEVESYQPLWFEAEEEGSYTLSWETANAEFEALTLIDNITGVTTDMLAHDSYTFEATTDQYVSRFKIVIGDWKDIEENEVPESVEGPTFAYYANGEIHLVETCHGASLQIVDVTGRVILSRDASNASAISTNGMVPGVYILRLTNGNETKTQKIVIE